MPNHMPPQIHKRLSDDQVKAILNKYQNKDISAKEAVQYLEVSRSRFYQLVEEYRDDPQDFSVRYVRAKPTRARCTAPQTSPS